MSNSRPGAEDRATGFQVAILLLSLYTVGALAVSTVFKLNPETLSLLNKIDTIICFVFLSDFAVRFYLADNRTVFMRWGWIDLVSSIPMLDVFRWGRLIRVIRILRILRGVRSARIIMCSLFAHRAKSTFGVVAMISATLVICSSLAILNAEDEPESNIKTSGDALWWAATTITTVGYGDKYPITGEGRVIGAILMTAGVGLFGTFTACVASFFIGGHKPQEASSDIAGELRALRERLDSLETKLSHAEVRLPAQFGGKPIHQQWRSSSTDLPQK